jgi:hypothetical protein
MRQTNMTFKALIVWALISAYKYYYPLVTKYCVYGLGARHLVVWFRYKMCIAFLAISENPEEDGYKVIIAINRDEYFNDQRKKHNFTKETLS